MRAADVDGWLDYTLTLDDERHIERTVDAFTSMQPLGSGSTEQYAGTLVLPPQIDGFYWGSGSTQQKTILPSTEQTPLATDGDLVLLRHDRLAATGYWRKDHELLSPSISQLIEDDMIQETSFGTASTAGNFSTLRCRVHLASSSSGTDYEVQGFTLSTVRLTTREANLNLLREVAAGRRQSSLNLWVLWSTSTGPTMTSVVGHMPSHAPTDVMPLHIGGAMPNSTTGIASGMHPFELTRDIYDELGVRYSTAAMANLIADDVYGRHWWRIKGPTKAADWLDENIYKPFGVVPFQQSSDGKIAPASIRAPVSSDVSGATTSLPELTASQVAWPHPTWRHSDDVLVTRLRFHYLLEDRVKSFNAIPDNRDDYGADWIKEEPENTTRDHDRISQLGVHEMDITLHGVHVPPSDIPNLPFAEPGKIADSVSRDFFTRYGDGAITGTLTPMSTLPAIVAGTYYRLNVPTFFNPATGSRGGERVIQAMTPIHTPGGPRVDWLDAGPAVDPLSAPTVALAASTGDPKHSIIVTIGGLSSGARYAVKTGLTTSKLDQVLHGTTANLTRQINSLPSGRTVYASGRQSMEGRITSAWSTQVNQATSAITGPTNLASSSVTGNTAVMSWTVGDTDYPVEFLLDQSSTCPSGDWGVIAALEPGSNTLKIDGLVLDSTHCTGVRHRDSFGGRSDSTSLSVQTTTDPEDAPAIDGIDIIAGVR
jgi:hypothetical protein